MPPIAVPSCPPKAAALAALLLGALLAPSAAAQSKKIDPTQPCFVDLQDVLRAYRKTSGFNKHQQTMRDRAQQYQREMELLAQLRFCTEAERREAIALKAKVRPSAQEQARLNALLKRADEVENEIAVLAQKNPPTEQETKRLQELSASRTEAVKNLAKEDSDRREQLRKLEIDLMTEVENELLALVAKIARDLKLVVVYERRAVLFGGNDLTEMVIAKLPK
jgi:Skp family chaperone for outer membrane proteins